VLNVFQRIAAGKPVAEKAREKWKVRLDLDTKHSQQVTSVAFSPDGKLLATGSLDKTVKLWEPASGKEIAMLKMSLAATYVEFSPDGRSLAAVETDVDEKQAGRISSWDVNTRRIRFWQNRHEGQVTSLAFSPDARLLASAGLDKRVVLWEVRRGKFLQELTGHTGPVNSVRFSPDGKILASASSDDTVRLWDPPSGKEIRRLQVHGGADGAAHRAGVRVVRFTSDGKWIVTAGDDALNLWEAVTGKQILEYFGQNGGVLIVEASPNGKTLAVTERHADQTVVLLNIEPMKELAKLTGHQQPVKSVAFSPDGNTLATAGDGSHIKLWSRELLPSRTQ
jgi:WD40 repeat protein